MDRATTEVNQSIAIVGLGYVGLPLAVAFSRVFPVIGFDIDERKIEDYKAGFDPTHEVGQTALKNSRVRFTSDECELRQTTFIVIAVPTPVDSHNIPDLGYLVSASKAVGRNLRQGAMVVYESTVYPGATEEICLPILERESGLKVGADFGLGYSPERINPGDKSHRLETVTKIVSGMDRASCELIAAVYGQIITAGVHRVSSIRVAEAAKVIENCQRDINIAFVNELAVLFGKMGLDTQEILDAAATKWNFLRFTPGLVGGHCIGVDPYYLAYKAQDVGYHPEVILAGRRINDTMPKHVAAAVVKLLIQTNCPVNNARVLILGLTFKENIPDIRNTKVVQIMQELHEFGVQTMICDPLADRDEVMRKHGFELSEFGEIRSIDAIVVAVAHDEYRRMTLSDLSKKLAPGRTALADVKGIYSRLDADNAGLCYWRL